MANEHCKLNDEQSGVKRRAYFVGAAGTAGGTSDCQK
jgi:hypothetical protein